MKARLLRVLGGRRGLFVGAAGFLLLVLPVTAGRPINVTAGATTPGIDFGLARGGRIGGTVTDAATGVPLAGVLVRIHSAGGDVVSTSSTNALGA